MSRRPRKSSACVTLVLIGAAALAGCGDAGRRPAYASKDACLADWGDPKECEEQPRASGGGGARTWGPSSGAWHSYSSGRSRSSSSSSSSGSHSVSRGGFGSHGSSAS